MQRSLILATILVLLCLRTTAVDILQAQKELFDTSLMQESLDDRTNALLETYDPAVQADFMQGVTKILNDAMEKSGGYFKSTVTTMLRILLVLILCKFLGSLGNETASNASMLVGALAIAAGCITDLRSMIGLGDSVMNQINQFMTALLPVMASVSAASGGATKGGAIYSVTVIFCDFLIQMCRMFLIPLMYAFLALGIADAALGQNRLRKLSELIGWIIKNLLKAVLYLFTGFLAATGVISGAADAAALKTAKFAISGMVPVVGSIVSDASESLLAGAGILKSAMGTFGMLAILAIFVLPFFRLGISYLGFKLTSAIGGLLESGQDRLLDTITSAMGYILAMVGSCTAISLIACCSFVKVALP